MVRRQTYNPRVVGLIPALTIFEDNILWQGVNTNFASLHPGVSMVTWSVVMNGICGCTLLYAARHIDQGVKCKVG